MKLFWFIRRHLAIIGLAALSYISADQLAIASVSLHRGESNSKYVRTPQEQMIFERAEQRYFEMKGKANGTVATALSR